MDSIIGRSSALVSLLSQEKADWMPVVVLLLQSSDSSGKCIILLLKGWCKRRTVFRDWEGGRRCHVRSWERWLPITFLSWPGRVGLRDWLLKLVCSTRVQWASIKSHKQLPQNVDVTFLLVLSSNHWLKCKRYNKSKVQIKQLVKKRKMKKTGLTNIWPVKGYAKIGGKYSNRARMTARSHSLMNMNIGDTTKRAWVHMHSYFCSNFVLG